MGLSFKKIGKTLTKTVKNPGNVLKKAVVVATGTVTGALAGGPLGAAAGAAAGVVKASKTGKAPALNLRTGYQTAIAGAAAGLVTGSAAKGLAKAGGIKGLTGKAVGFVKQGGLAKNAAKWGATVAKGFTAFKAKAEGVTEGFDSPAFETVTDAFMKASDTFSETFRDNVQRAEGGDAGQEYADMEAPRAWGWKPIAAISAAVVGAFLLLKPAAKR